MDHRRHFLKCFKFLIIIVISTANRANSKSYTVGDGDEWGIGTNYMAWSQKYNFSVGDVLVFNYVRGQHDACEVTKETYRSCDTRGGGVIREYESGNDVVVLAEARKYWFICSVSGHCLGGMKFGVDVLQEIAPDSMSEPVAPADASEGRVGVDKGKVCWAAALVATLGVLLMTMNS